MSFFISDALADAAPAADATGSGLGALIPLVGFFLIFYFLMIRPQVKRQKEHKKMVESLAKGDEVQLEGGLMGKVTKLGDEVAKVEIADGVVVKVRRQSIGAVLPKGTLADQ